MTPIAAWFVIGSQQMARGVLHWLVCASTLAGACTATSISVQDRDAPYLLAVPHGQFDWYTDRLAEVLCPALRWDCVIARGFRAPPGRYNVNRPTRGPGLRSIEEQRTPRAEAIYQGLRSAIHSIRAPHLSLYVEIHGNSVPRLHSTIEVATAGITVEQAGRIKAILEHELHAVGLSTIRVAMEGVDPIYWVADATEAWGTLGELQPALHFELPPSLRRRERARTAGFLVTALRRIADAEFQASSPPVAPPPRDRPSALPRTDPAAR